MIPFARWFLRYRLLKQLPDLRTVRQVLVLCTANRVRSPFAAALLRTMVPPSVTVTSRGILPGGGRCPGESIEAASEYQVDLSDHRARQLEAPTLLQADLVLTMDLRMAHDLVVRYPATLRTVVPLRTFDPDGGGMADIADPYMLPQPEYDATYAIIARCCRALSDRMGAHALR